MSRSGRAWIDGGSRGNPGPAGFGVLLETEEGREEILGYLGKTTNNVAEYTGLLAALTRATQMGLEELQISSDSELLVRQMSGRYQVKAPHLVPFYRRALELKRSLKRLTLRHVPRSENSEADGLANQAIDTRARVPEWLVLPGHG